MMHHQHPNVPDEARLQRAMDRAAHPDTTGDWNAVLQAAQERRPTPTGPRRWWPAVIVGAAAAVAGTWTVVVLRGPNGSNSPLPGASVVTPLSVANDQAAIDAVDLRRIRGDELVLGRDVLASHIGGGDDVTAPLRAGSGPFAVSTAGSAAAVIVPTWTSFDSRTSPPDGAPDGRPSLVWIRNGRSSVLAPGALAPALSRSGRLAYAAGVDPVYRINRRYLTRIMVGSAGSSTMTRWTTGTGKYFPVAWAGDRLIAYEQLEGEETRVLILSGPGRIRRLRNVDGVIAVSPDGRQIAVTDSISMVAIVDVASGATVAQLPLGDSGSGAATVGVDASDRLATVMTGGSWRGSRIVVSTPTGLAVLDAAASRLRVVAIYPTRELPHSIDRPVWIDDDTVVGSADVARLPRTDIDAYSSGFVVCHLSTHSCATGDVTQNPLQWRRWVELPNP